MRYQGERESTNVEDRRGGGVRRAGALGGGSLILVLVAMLFGFDPSELLDQGGAPVAAGPVQSSPQEDEQVKFIRVVLGVTEDVWNTLFAQNGVAYREPTLTLFRDAVHTACGTQSSQVGPFYCPGDHHVYLDMDFLETMRKRLGAPGDFAQAYVIAHEVGHHVQNLLGYSEKVRRLQSRASKTEANQWSVRLELQADFLAGVWAHHAQKLHNLLEQGDIQEAMNAAAAVGDDKLQRQTTGAVRPESFTHGTSQQRVNAFALGLKTGDLNRAVEFLQ